MNQEMSTLFPNGIRALVVDDDAKFLTSACMMLSILDFKVTTCASPTTALNILTREKIKDVNVVLANAAKVAACGFDFRGIVESDLFIPVVYFLPLDHKATGDEADELLRTLQAATYIIKKPLDAGQVCDLWKDIAWRMCFLEAKANQAGRNRVAVPAGGGEEAGGGSAMAEEREDEERIHFKVVKTGGSRKRKSAAGNPGGSSGTSLAGHQPGQIQKQKNVTGGQETGNFFSQQQERRSIKAKKNDGEAPELQEPDAMEDQQPGMFGDTAVPSNNNVAAGNTTASPAPPPALPPVNPALCPVHSAPEPSLPAPPSRVYPAPALQHAAHNVFDTTAPMVAITTMAATVTSTPQFSQEFRPFSSYQHQNMSVPWSQGSSGMQQRRGTGPIMLSFQRPPPAGDLFTGMASGGVTFGGASATADAGVYGNEASSLIQSLNLGTDGHDKLNPPLALQNAGAGAASNVTAMAALYNDNYCARALMAPHHIGRGVAPHEGVSSGGYIDYTAVLAMARQQQVGHSVAVAQEEAAGGMEEATNSNSFSNHSSGSSPHLAFNTEDCFSNYSAASHMAAPDQIVGNGMASNVNELTMAGEAFGSSNVAVAVSIALEVEHPVVAAPNGNQEMFPDEQYEENTMFTLEDLLGHDDQQDGTTAGAAADADAAGTLVIGKEGDKVIWDNNMFTVEDLLGLDGQQGGATGGAAATDAAGTLVIGGEGDEVIWDNNMFTVEDLLGLDDQQGGATGGAVTAADAAGTSLIGGEEGEGTWDIGAADNLDDFFVGVGDLWNFNMPSYDANNGRE